MQLFQPHCFKPLNKEQSTFSKKKLNYNSICIEVQIILKKLGLNSMYCWIGKLKHTIGIFFFWQIFILFGVTSREKSWTFGVPPRFNENKDQYNEHEQCNGIIKIKPLHLSDSGPKILIQSRPKINQFRKNFFDQIPFSTISKMAPKLHFISDFSPHQLAKTFQNLIYKTYLTN